MILCKLWIHDFRPLPFGTFTEPNTDPARFGIYRCRHCFTTRKQSPAPRIMQMLFGIYLILMSPIHMLTLWMFLPESQWANSITIALAISGHLLGWILASGRRFFV